MSLIERESANMVKDKIKNWLRDVINLGADTSDDVNVDIAKANYKKYEDELVQRQKDYIKTICNRIKTSSRNGCRSIDTANLLNDFMTYDFMMEMKNYFEQRGFFVEEKSSSTECITSWLRISWE